MSARALRIFKSGFVKPWKLIGLLEYKGAIHVLLVKYKDISFFFFNHLGILTYKYFLWKVYIISLNFTL
ncbi:hypothetical protein XENTR_v10012470 [Xenopus tropicalis]|nr:hypothetical protein XENTR_v10012470 [Xenopus tropicalis]